MIVLTKKIFCLLTLICLLVTLSFSISTIKASGRKCEYLIGKVIYIDAGHGGKDNGASFSGVLEDEINLKIAGYVIENLIDIGAYVLTSRTGDYDLSNIYDKNKKRNDLINRVRHINDSKADLFISIHLNSYSSETISGAQVFHQRSEESKVLAQEIQKSLNVLTTGKNRNVKIGDYYLLNKTKSTGVIVECGFLSNSKERDLLVKGDYQRKIAKKITEGIIKYFNNIVD